MRTIVIETLGNIILFIFLALALTMGVVISQSDRSFIITVNGFIFALIAYVIFYGFILVNVNRKQKAPFWHLVTGIQIHHDVDERECSLTAHAAKAAYGATMCVLLSAVFVFAMLHFATVAFALNTDFYALGCWFFTLSCIVINLSFSTAWIREYTKA